MVLFFFLTVLLHIQQVFFFLDFIKIIYRLSLIAPFTTCLPFVCMLLYFQNELIAPSGINNVVLWTFFIMDPQSKFDKTIPAEMHFSLP